MSVIQLEKVTSILFGSNTMTQTLVGCQKVIISAYQTNVVDEISCWKMAINPQLFWNAYTWIIYFCWISKSNYPFAHVIKKITCMVPFWVKHMTLKYAVDVWQLCTLLFITRKRSYKSPQIPVVNQCIKRWFFIWVWAYMLLVYIVLRSWP